MITKPLSLAMIRNIRKNNLKKGGIFGLFIENRKKEN